MKRKAIHRKWNRIMRATRMITKKTNVRPSGLADPLRYVFLQMDEHHIGKKATGYEYVPNRRAMTVQERTQARRTLRAALRDSVSML